VLVSLVTPVLLENQIVTMQCGWSFALSMQYVDIDIPILTYYNNTQILYETTYCFCESAITEYFDSLKL